MAIALASLLLLCLPVPRVQESAAILDAPLVSVEPGQRLDLVLDLDGDGFQDAVAYVETPTTKGWQALRNDHTGRFSAVSGSTTNDARPVVAQLSRCEVEADGRDDFLFLVPGTNDGLLRVVKHSAALVPELVAHLGYQGPLDLAAILDVDHDGDADRVRFSAAGLELALDTFQQASNGSWSSVTTTLRLAFQPDVLLVLDADGNGDPDLYLQDTAQAAFVSLTGGALHAPTALPAPPLEHTVAGDVDGDGDTDLVLSDASQHVLERRGPGFFSREAPHPGGPITLLADVDADGDLDGLACTNASTSPWSPDAPATFRVALNDGTGAFAPGFVLPGLGARDLAGVADLEHDGDVDLVAGQCVYFARGPLARAPGRVVPSGEPAQRALFDFDRDGDDDFAPGLDEFERNLGDGFSRPFRLSAPTPPDGTRDEGPGLPGDWDGDGDVDLLVRRTDANGLVGWRFLANKGGGRFTDARLASVVELLPDGAPVRAENSFAVDLDLDGNLDLVTFARSTPAQPDGTTLTWHGNGFGVFTPAGRIDGAWPLGFAPVAGDRWPAALLVHPGGMLAVQRGLADGTFEMPPFLSFNLGTSVGPTSIALADLDQDGDLDLAAAIETDPAHAVGLFVPNVGGRLTRTQSEVLEELDDERAGGLPAPAPRVALAGDVDGDGRLDLLFAAPNERRAAVSLVRRSADGLGWLAPVRQVVYRERDGAADVRAGACLDLDGDGNAELVTDTLWRNALRPVPDGGRRRQDTSGIADARGLVPVLGASGPFRAGERVVLRLTNAPGGSLGRILVEVPGIGGRALALPRRFREWRTFQTSGTSGDPGAGEWELAFRVPPALVGTSPNFVAEIFDRVRTPARVRSNELHLYFGP